MAHTTESIRNVAVVGHRGVGKTSLIEAMLYLARIVPKMGAPGAWASSLDSTPEEQSRLATFDVRAVSLNWHGKKLNLLDTPGEGSFLGQTRLALAAADAAILAISARDGVQSGTERIFRWLREAKIPTLIVVTKVDDVRARLDQVVEEIRTRLDEHADLMEVPEGEGADFHGVVSVETGDEWPAPEDPATTPRHQVPTELHDAYEKVRAKLVDDAAASDDTLTEHFLETGDLSREELDAGVRGLVTSGQMFPLFLASPVRPCGVAPLLDAIVDLLPSPQQSEVNAPTSAFVFKTHLDPHAGRTTWMKVRAGKIARDQQLMSVSSQISERATQVLALSGTGFEAIGEAVAGDIIAVPKLKSSRAGDTLRDEKSDVPAVAVDLPPAMFSRAFIAEGRTQQEKLSSALHTLAEEDPSLQVSHEGVAQGTMVAGVGALHLDVTLDRAKRMTKVEVTLGPPRIPYRETVTRRVEHIEGKQKKQTGGHGQFGVVYLDVEPLPRGTGFQFEDAVVGGSVPRQFISSVEKGVRKALTQGVLAGFPIEDVKVRLVDGKAHSVDSSDAAFQVAGYKAFEAAVETAQPALLEPVMKVDLTVPLDSLGDVVGSLSARNGRVLSTDQEGTVAFVSAHVPLSQLLDYEPRLTAMTSGRGTFTMSLDHYDLVPPNLMKGIVDSSGYRRAEAD